MNGKSCDCDTMKAKRMNKNKACGSSGASARALLFIGPTNKQRAFNKRCTDHFTDQRSISQVDGSARRKADGSLIITNEYYYKRRDLCVSRRQQPGGGSWGARLARVRACRKPEHGTQNNAFLGVKGY